MHSKRFAFAVLLTCLAGAASADEFAYVCEVHHIYNLQKNGSLETSSGSALEKMVKGYPFSVSRETGSLTGNSTSMDTSRAKSIRVIIRGSKENSFRAVADFGDFESGNHPYQLLEIEEFQPGASKPFVLMGELGIVTGLCK